MTTNPISGWRRFTSRFRPATKLDVLEILMTMEQAIAEIVSVRDQLIKSRDEILAKFKALEDATGGLKETTPEFDTALAELKSTVQSQDDLITDQEPT